MKKNPISLENDEILRRKKYSLPHAHPELLKQQDTFFVEKQAKVLMKRFASGYEAIINEIKTRPSLSDSYQISAEAQQQIGNSSFWEDHIQDPEDLQEMCGFSDEDLLLFYDVAKEFYENKKYADALQAFTFLCELNHSVSSFWIGQALSFEAMHDFENAMDAFEKASQEAPSDFFPFLGMIRCSQTFQEYTKVKALLEAQRENSSMKEEVKAALEFINNI